MPDAGFVIWVGDDGVPVIPTTGWPPSITGDTLPVGADADKELLVDWTFGVWATVEWLSVD